VGWEYKLIFGPRSRTDLKELVIYTRRISGDSGIAERLGKKLIEKALSLATLPERGRTVPELARADTREIIYKNYRIVYRIKRITSKFCDFGMHLEARRR